MFEGVEHRFQVPYDGSFRIAEAPTEPPEGAPSRKECEKDLHEAVQGISEMQELLYAADRQAVLLVFQAMDAAGKDGTIRAVLTGVNPAGCQVHSFKRPSDQELDHDFLWRHVTALPERGRIGIFNRSWYEEVLVVRVHPELLDHQKLPWRAPGEALWQERLQSIADLERHVARNGTVVLKFFLHVSKEEQKRRLLGRIEETEKNWKFEVGDVKERHHWDAYQQAYEAALNATSRPWAPWYAVPADNKPYMRRAVARILRKTLESLHLTPPRLGEADQHELAKARQRLERETR
jgi:PPK2 family polyphosphate:nucleotide phosphotransferase